MTMPADDPAKDLTTGQPSYTRVTTETVQRGDLYVPLADRFDKLERRVSLLTWAVIIDIAITTVGPNGSGFIADAIRLLSKLTGN